MATKILCLELEQPLPTRIEGAEDYDHIWVYVFKNGTPIGCVTIENGRLPVLQDQLRQEIIVQVGWMINNELEREEDEKTGPVLEDTLLTNPASLSNEPEFNRLLPELKPEPGQKIFLSIVVCTYDRPDDLRRCLESLTKLESGIHRLEVIVVDNHPSSRITQPVVQSFPGVRYEIEPRQGVAYARNMGLKTAAGDIVAYIDDDVIVPPGWVQKILSPFADSRVMCVSGLVLPLELETESQEMFEKYGGLGRGFQPKIFDRKFFATPYAVHTWDLGGTANVAIRKTVIQQSGMFDETLGPGLPTGVGEDIYMFYRILKFNHICYYEPAAYVWHKHRNSLEALKKQLYGYNKGQTSYQLRTLVTDGDKRVIRQLLFDLPLWHLKRLYRILRGHTRYPLSLVWEELRGNLVGPYAFYKSVRMHRKLNGPGSNPISRG